MKVNKIYLGDAYKLIKKIPDKSIDCIYTDIPYLFESGGGGLCDLSIRVQKVKDSLTDINITQGIDYSIYDEFIRVSKKINIFIWLSRLQLLDTMNYFISKGYQYRLLTWNKTNPIPTTNNSWLPDIEYCLYIKDDTFSLNDGYDLKSQWYLSSTNKKDKELYDHPTIKPLDLVKRHIEHTTQVNDIVLDPFLGSGTTAAAAKDLNRNYIGFELDRNFYKIACNRLNNISQVDVKMAKLGYQNIFDILDAKKLAEDTI